MREIDMASELTFRKIKDADSWIMTRTYDLRSTYADDETGSTEYRYVPERPADVARLTGRWPDKNGRLIQTGIVVINGRGIGYAWPLDLFDR
jgi:hypothetical protein